MAASDRTAVHPTPVLERTAQELLQIQESIERMAIRVNAFHAHHGSLNRAAQGIRTIHDRVESVLKVDVAERGWSPEHRLAASALEATRQQVRLVLEADRTLPMEKQRACLNHALARATEALELLLLDRDG